MPYKENTPRQAADQGLSLSKLRLQLLENGYVPLPARGKAVMLSGWRDVQPDAAQVRAWGDKRPQDTNTGIRLGGGLVAVDIDVLDSDTARQLADKFEWMTQGADLPPLRIGRAPKCLLLVRVEDQQRKMITGDWYDADGQKHAVEVLAEGQQFIAYGTHPDTGKAYTWADDVGPLHVKAADLPTVTGEQLRQFLDEAKALFVQRGWAHKGEASFGAHRQGRGKSGEDWGTILDALDYIPNDELDEETWRNIGMALHEESEGSAEGLRAFMAWSAQSTKHKPLVTRTRWNGFRAGAEGNIGGGTILSIARRHGWGGTVTADDFQDDDDDEVSASVDRSARSREIAALAGEPTKSRGVDLVPIVKGKLHLNERGSTKATLHNAIAFVLKVNEDRGFGLRHDLMRNRDEWRDGQITDADLAMIRVAVERAGMQNINDNLISKAVVAVCQIFTVHPVRDWLTSLQHDGRPRLDTWLTRYLRAEDSVYVRAIGRAFLIAMVARVMRPGCKHDAVLVLGGPQGIGKSQACAVLGGQWFGDNMPSIREGSKEASLYLRGHWLVELAELAPSRKAEAEDLKAFLSRGSDEIRAPYARLPDLVERQSVFVGTTNDHAFLRDPTGNRRFWPVELMGAVDVSGLAEDRDQLFAEALAAFDAGKPWHLSPEVERLAAKAQEAVSEEDTWEGEIRAIVADEDKISMADVLQQLGIPLERQRMAETKRAGAILRRLGWSRRSHRTGKFWHRA